MLAAVSADLPLLVLAAYRSYALPRQHPLRAARHALRRAGALRELELQPLDADATRALAGRVLGRPPDDAVAARLHARSAGCRSPCSSSRRPSRPGPTRTRRCRRRCARPS